jgi:hypothetical protein
LTLIERELVEVIGADSVVGVNPGAEEDRYIFLQVA